jgi:hypothetical protein
MMSNLDLLKTAIQEIETAADPIAKGKELIVANNGFWAEADPLDQKALFQFQLFEVTAIGWGASDALSIWLRQAKERYSQCIDQ